MSHEKTPLKGVFSWETVLLLIIPLPHHYFPAFSVDIDERVFRYILVDMDIGSYLGSSVDSCCFISSYGHDTIWAKKDPITDYKMPFSSAIIIGTFPSSSEIHFFTRGGVDYGCSGMFCFVMLSKVWFLHFTADDTSLGEWRITDNASPEYLTIISYIALFDAYISLYCYIISQNCIREHAKRPHWDWISECAVGENRGWMDFLVHGVILVKIFYYPYWRAFSCLCLKKAYPSDYETSLFSSSLPDSSADYYRSFRSVSDSEIFQFSSSWCETCCGDDFR